MRFQKTVARSVSISGQGLHSGQPTTLTLHPAAPETGLIFQTTACDSSVSCPVNIKHLHRIDLCTTLSVNGTHIQTVEHLLSALSGLEIDNAYLEISGSEIPALDGSAAPFVELIHEAGIMEQEVPRVYLKIVHPISVEKEGKSLSVYPASLQKISYSIDYAHPLIQTQTYVYHGSPTEFQRQIASARTFAFKQEVEGLWSRGLGMGGSLDNTLVFSETELMNKTGLRFSDECVRHKVLDLIGDMTLLGLPVIGHFVADRAGHQLHTELVAAILDNPDAWILLNNEVARKKLVSVPEMSCDQDALFPQAQPMYSSL